MIELIISLALAAILLLFVVFGLLWGLKRGLKKTLFRAAWLAVTAVLLFAFTPMITRAVMNADLSALDLNVGGEQVTTLQEYVVALLGQDADLGQIAADNPQAVSSLVQIASLAVNVFVFVLLFWALKIVLWPIWAILSAIFIRKRTLSGEKKPQHRLWGMLAGAVLGLLVCMITLTPLTGTANFALAVEDQTKGTALAAQLAGGQADPDKGLLLQAAGEENARYVELYRDSVGRKILRYTGMEALSDWIYGGLSSNTVNGVRVSLTDEVLTALSVADRGMALLDVDFENLTKEQLTQLLSDLRGLNEDIFSIGVLSAVGNDLMPYFIAKAADGEWFELPDLGTPELNAALSDTLRGLEGLTFADLKNEIDRVLDVGVLLNNEDILPDLLAGGEPDFEAIAAKVDEDFASSLADALFSMKSITVAFPAFLGAGLDFAIEELGGTLPEGAGGSATAEQMKTFLVDLLTDGVELYQSLDPDSDYYLTQPSLALAGSLLDTVRQYPGIGAERYAALVNAFEAKIRTALEENLTDPELEGIRSVLFDLVDGLSEADSFGADFAALGEKFDDFVAFADGMRAEPAEVRLTELGGVLDGFAQTALFGDSLNDLLSAGLDYAKSVLPEDFASLSANLDSMKGRLDEVQSWETELGHYMGLYEVIEEVGGDTFDPETLFEADNDLLERFGAALNGAEASTLLQPELKSVFEILLDQAESSLGSSDLAGAMLDQIRANLRAGENFDWEAEFAAVKRLGAEVQNISGDLTEELALSVGAALDEIVQGNSQLLSRAAVNEMICAAVDELSANVPGEVDLAGVIDSLKTAVRTTPDLGYENEMGALFSLFDEVSALDASSLDNLDLTGLGGTLDSFDQTSGSRPSVLVSAIRFDLVDALLVTVSDQTDDQRVKEIVGEIRGNVDNIQSFAAEFGHLQTFVDEIGSMTGLDGSDASALTAFGATLDDLADSRLLAGYGSDQAADVRQSMVEMILDQVAEGQTDGDIRDLVTDMKAAVPSISSYETEFSALNDFVDRVEEMQNADMADFSLAGFGAALDGYSDFEGQGPAVLICAVRESVVSLAVDRVDIDVTGTDIPQEAVDEILANAKTCAAQAEAGELTYARLFGDLDQLRTMAENPPEIVVTRDSADVTGVGTYLDEMQALSVVPTKSVLRVSQSLLAAVASAADGVEGVDDPRVQEARTALNEEIARLDGEYTAALAQEQPAERNFGQDYAAVTQKLTALMQAVNDMLPAAP